MRQSADALRAAGVTPGPVYSFPHCTHKDMKSPEVVEKFKRGPVGLLTCFPADRGDGEISGLWFVYCVVIGIFVACVAAVCLPWDAVSDSVPRRRHRSLPGVRTRTNPGLDLERADVGRDREALFDGLIYALLTAGTFGWLWPK